MCIFSNHNDLRLIEHGKTVGLCFLNSQAGNFVNYMVIIRAIFGF